MHRPGNLTAWAVERGICRICWAYNETFWRFCFEGSDVRGGTLEPRAGLTRGVVEPVRLDFPKSKSPLSQVVPRTCSEALTDACMGSGVLPSALRHREADLFIHIFRLGDQGLESSTKVSLSY